MVSHETKKRGRGLSALIENAPAGLSDIAEIGPAHNQPETATWSASTIIGDPASLAAKVKRIIQPAAADQTTADQEVPAPGEPVIIHRDPAPAQFKNLSPAQIAIKSNFRKTFDEAAIAELAESIKAHGIIQPLVVRPVLDNPGSIDLFELVAGERRYRAAQLAGMEELPCMVRHLTDKEFFEVQILENLQRKDVPAMEEAEGFQNLLDNGFTIDEIAQKLGKPKPYVHQRLRLNSLSDFWKNRFQKDQMYLKTALAIARLTPDNQKEVERSWWAQNSSFISHGELEGYLKSHIYLTLHSAPFSKKDTALYPKAGACINCQKRTGCNTFLFEDMAKNDSCLDKACFEQKWENYLEQRFKALGEEYPGIIRVTKDYQSNDPAILPYRDYNLIYEGRKATGLVKKALVVAGNDRGSVIDIEITKSAEVKAHQLSDPEAAKAAQEAQKKERRETIRKNRIEVRVKSLLADQLAEAFATGMRKNGYPPAAIINHFLDKTIGYGGGSDAQRTRLVEVFGWPQIDWKNTSYEEHNQWKKEAISAMDPALKLLLYFDVELQDLNKEYCSNLMQIAKADPDQIDLKATEQLAADIVDKKAVAPQPPKF